MSTGILHLHSFIPYLLLILLLLAFAANAMAWQKNNAVSSSMNTLTKAAFILSHIQLLAGLFLLFFGDKAKAAFGHEDGMKMIMKDSDLRLSLIEHPLMMVIAVVLITIGYVGSKKKEGSAKSKKIAIFYGLALVLIFARIPWQAWLN